MPKNSHGEDFDITADYYMLKYHSELSLDTIDEWYKDGRITIRDFEMYKFLWYNLTNHYEHTNTVYEAGFPIVLQIREWWNKREYKNIAGVTFLFIPQWIVISCQDKLDKYQQMIMSEYLPERVDYNA